MFRKVSSEITPEPEFHKPFSRKKISIYIFLVHRHYTKTFRLESCYLKIYIQEN